MRQKQYRRAAVILAASSIFGSTAIAQTQYVVSTSGATALGQFTSANSDRVNPTVGTIVRGTLAIGTNFKLNDTVYTVPSAGAEFIGIANLNNVLATEPTLAEDRVVYYYRESGSIQGILDTADSAGLLIATGNQPTLPGDPASNLLVFVNGARFNSVATTYSSGSFPNGIPSTVSPTPNTGYTNGRNYTVAPNPIGLKEVNSNGQPLVRIGWTDVRFQQAFALNEGAPSTEKASFRRTPTTPGYGIGPKPIAGTNVQPLRNSAAISGGINADTTRLRNESLAVIPFNIVANPGTGLAEISQEEGQWLQVVGRLPNGANFNSVTREIGSGTRNQGDLNLLLDPAWGGGERDRRYVGTTPIVGGTNTGAGERPDVRDNDGNFVTINPGGEVLPTLNLTGGTVQTINENRVSPTMRFGDKISGSTGVRQTVVNNRMGLGILSAGDSNSSTAGTAIAGLKDTTGVPMRALRIDWDNSGPNAGLQATADNVVTGAYRMWSAAQAVTVAPYANPEKFENKFLADGVTLNPDFDPVRAAWRPINGDLNDQDDTTIDLGTDAPTLDINGNVTNADNVGVHRKFLDNITKSVATFTGVGTAVTPADFVISSRFIPPQIMKVSKAFDGAAQVNRTLSTVDPDAAGPQVSEQTLFNELIGPGKFLTNATNWGDPGTTNGGLGNQAVKYRIFATLNTNSSTAATAANRAVDVSPRTNTVGDLNGDGVRDLNDTAAFALAYASPSTYLTTAAPGVGQLNDQRRYNGTAVNVVVNGGAGVFSTIGTNAATSDGLIVLTDFDGNGNVVVDANDSTFATTPVSRADVEFFLWGATVDTGALSSDTATNTNKRENLVRTGQLRKNFAIDSYNSTMDKFVVGTGSGDGEADIAGFTQSNANALKFEKRDVDGSGSNAFGPAPEYNFLVDAFAVDKFAGQSYRDLDEQSVASLAQPFKLNNGTTIFVESPFNLVRAELNDSSTGDIDQNDMDVMNAGLTTTAGVNPIGRVDHTWAAVTTKTGSTNIVVAPATGTVVVPAGGVFNINGGTFTAGGTVDIFTAGGNSLSVVNNADLVIAAGSKKLTALTGTGDTTIAAGATLVLGDPSQGSFDVEGSLEVLADGGVAGTLYTGSLTIGLAGLVNLNDNDLVVDYTGSSPLAALVAAQLAGQLVSAADFGGVSTTLVLFEAADFGLTEFNTFALDSGDAVIGKFTYTGDSNLDGQVNAFDYSIVDDNFGNAGTFVTGDLNGDGFVDSFDYSAIDDTFGAGVGSPLRPAASTEVFIPEPSSLSLLALAGGLLARRRRA